MSSQNSYNMFCREQKQRKDELEHLLKLEKIKVIEHHRKIIDQYDQEYKRRKTEMQVSFRKELEQFELKASQRMSDLKNLLSKERSERLTINKKRKNMDENNNNILNTSLYTSTSKKFKQDANTSKTIGDNSTTHAESDDESSFKFDYPNNNIINNSKTSTLIRREIDSIEELQNYFNQQNEHFESTSSWIPSISSTTSTTTTTTTTNNDSVNNKKRKSVSFVDENDIIVCSDDESIENDSKHHDHENLDSSVLSKRSKLTTKESSSMPSPYSSSSSSSSLSATSISPSSFILSNNNNDNDNNNDIDNKENNDVLFSTQTPHCSYSTTTTAAAFRSIDNLDEPSTSQQSSCEATIFTQKPSTTQIEANNEILSSQNNPRVLQTQKVIKMLKTMIDTDNKKEHS